MIRIVIEVIGSEIGNRVASLRAARGWSQRKLGGLSGTSGSYISQLESGQLPKPGVVQLGRIAHALGVQLEELLAAPSGNRLAEERAGYGSIEAEVGQRVLQEVPLSQVDVIVEFVRGWSVMTDYERGVVLNFQRMLLLMPDRKAKDQGIARILPAPGTAEFKRLKEG